jgi:pimeloyl-ACP methyl ester carboxylesterase
VTGAGAAPDRLVLSADGTPIAVFTSGVGPPLVLVHGTTADHTTWRAAGPLLAGTFTVHAIDRRGRGASGDGPGPYAIEREYEDLAAVAGALAAETGGPVDVVGHSYGGRCALGAALLTASIGRIVVYESAPSPAEGGGYRPSGVERRIRDLIESDRRDAALETFFREIVRMPEPDLAAYRADPVWPVRVAAVHTSLRELEGEASPAASLEALGGVRQPVLQVLGGDSSPVFHEATVALDARLANGRVVVIDGARHAAHHTHVDAFVDSIRAFLANPSVAD